MAEVHKDQLTQAQKELVLQLKAEVAGLVEAHAPLIHFCNEHTYVRYLRARGWNLAKAAKMLRATLEWRLEFKPHLIKFHEVKEESVTGKNAVYPHPDKHNRPIVLMRPRVENTKTSDRQIRYLIYVLERASALADQRGVGKMAWLLDFEGYSTSNAPPLRVSMQCNSILQNHYPERLGVAVCYHAPFLFSMTWKAVRPFIDTVTQQKIMFADKGAAEAEVMPSLFHMDRMEACMGGQVPDYAFDLAAFEKECEAYDAQLEREIQQIEMSMRERSGVGLPAADSCADMDVAVTAEKMGKLDLNPVPVEEPVAVRA